MNKRKYIIIEFFHIHIFCDLQTTQAHREIQVQQSKNFFSACFIGRGKQSVLRSTLKTSKTVIENERCSIQMMLKSTYRVFQRSKVT